MVYPLHYTVYIIILCCVCRNTNFASRLLLITAHACAIGHLSDLSFWPCPYLTFAAADHATHASPVLASASMLILPMLLNPCWFLNTIFVSIEPYVLREPRKEPSNRRFYMNTVDFLVWSFSNLSCSWTVFRITHLWFHWCCCCCCPLLLLRHIPCTFSCACSMRFNNGVAGVAELCFTWATYRSISTGIVYLISYNTRVRFNFSKHRHIITHRHDGCDLYMAGEAK